MKNKHMRLWVLISFLVLLTGFKKNRGEQPIPPKMMGGIKDQAGILMADPVKVSIADATAVRGDKGQRPVKVMIYLSRPATEQVIVKYSTENGSAKAGVDYVATNGSVTFEIGEVAKWINVLIVGQVAADPDEDPHTRSTPTFIVKITQAIGQITQTTGVIIGMAKAYISILPLIPANVGGKVAVYEVIISFMGYTTFSVKAEECGIRKSGIVVLSGLLMGIEDLSGDDDSNYEGDLEMIMDIDICSMKTDNRGESSLCGITVNGSGKVLTKLKITYGTDMSGNYDGRGGYIQIEDTTGRFRRTVTGNCDQPQMDEELTMVPNKTIASIFNGFDLPMLVQRTLTVGRYSHTDEDGNVTTVEVLRKIR